VNAPKSDSVINSKESYYKHTMKNLELGIVLYVPRIGGEYSTFCK
jgi:hypothetical protein